MKKAENVLNYECYVIVSDKKFKFHIFSKVITSKTNSRTVQFKKKIRIKYMKCFVKMFLITISMQLLRILLEIWHDCCFLDVNTCTECLKKSKLRSVQKKKNRSKVSIFFILKQLVTGNLACRLYLMFAQNGC